MKMKTQHHQYGQKYQQIFLGVIVSGLSATIFAISPIHDDLLSENMNYVGTITPVVITAVKRDIQESVVQQNQKNHQLAGRQADEIKKDHLTYVVLNDHEQQKKETDAYQHQVDKRPLLPNKAKVIEYGVSAQDSLVKVTTQDKITIYIKRDTH